MPDERRLKIVAFCGAGFSVSAGYPTLAGFGTALRRGSFLSETELRDFDHIQAACNDLAMLLDESARNIEQLASFLSVLAISNPQYRFPGATAAKSPDDALALVRKAVNCVYLPRTSQTSADWLLALASPHDLGIVTTNYDLNIEMSAVSRGCDVNCSESVRRALVSDSMNSLPSNLTSIYKNRHLRRDPQWQVSLAKLHGSVNWFELGAQIHVSDLWQLKSVNDPTEGSWLALDSKEHSWAKPESAISVAPTLLKSYAQTAIQEQWTLAAQLLSEAEVLIFVGYSFPESDLFMRYFIAASLFHNTQLHRIIVIDPSHEVLARYEAFAFPNRWHREIVESIPLTWEVCSTVGIEPIVSGSIPTSDHLAGQLAVLRRKREHEATLRGEPAPETSESARTGRSRSRRLGR